MTAMNLPAKSAAARIFAAKAGGAPAARAQKKAMSKSKRGLRFGKKRHAVSTAGGY